MPRDPAQAAGMIDITTNSISMASRLPSCKFFPALHHDQKWKDLMYELSSGPVGA